MDRVIQTEKNLLWFDLCQFFCRKSWVEDERTGRACAADVKQLVRATRQDGLRLFPSSFYLFLGRTMAILYLMAPGFSSILLTLHFFRSDIFPAMLFFGALVFLLLVRRPWAARFVQGSLLLGAIEWIRTIIALVTARMAMGEPFIRLAFILGGVALLTACSALLFQTSTIRTYFKIDAAIPPVLD